MIKYSLRDKVQKPVKLDNLDVSTLESLSNISHSKEFPALELVMGLMIQATINSISNLNAQEWSKKDFYDGTLAAIDKLYSILKESSDLADKKAT